MNTITKIEKTAKALNVDSIQVYKCAEKFDFRIACCVVSDIPVIDCFKGLSEFNTLKQCKAKDAAFYVTFYTVKKGTIKTLYLN